MKIKDLTCLAFTLVMTSYGCSPEIESSETPDYLAAIKQVEQIRINEGYIPVNSMVSDFDASSIDFSEHFGIKSTGIDDVVVKRKEESFELYLYSNWPGFNHAIITVYPETTGYNATLRTQKGEQYTLVSNKDKPQNNSFTHLSNSGKSFTMNARDIAILKERYNDQVNVTFKVSSYVLFAIRELYYKHLLSKMPVSFFDQEGSLKTHDTNSRTNSSHCEYYPSIYVSSLCSGVFLCQRDIEVELNTKCSNQYCIGCCWTSVEKRECAFENAWCYMVGYGFMCVDYPDYDDWEVPGGCGGPRNPCPIGV